MTWKWMYIPDAADVAAPQAPHIEGLRFDWSSADTEAAATSLADAWEQGYRQGVEDATSVPRAGMTYRVTPNPYDEDRVLPPEPQGDALVRDIDGELWDYADGMWHNATYDIALPWDILHRQNGPLRVAVAIVNQEQRVHRDPAEPGERRPCDSEENA